MIFCRILAGFSVLILTSCSATRTLPNHCELLRATRVDTIYANTTKYDSVYVNNWYFIDHGKDTVFVHQKDVEYRYKLLRDTIRVVRIDSIPVVKAVEVTHEVSYVPSWVKSLAWLGGITLSLLLLLLGWMAAKRLLPLLR